MSDIFSKSGVSNTKFFALDIDLVIQLLSSFDGKQLYPETKTKEETFDDATKERRVKLDWGTIPDGEYYLSEYKSNFDKITATMRVQVGVFTVIKGSICAPTEENTWHPESRKIAQIENNTLWRMWIVIHHAGWVSLGSANNGWFVWKNKEGEPINIYRNK